jgi:hypothetical protein
MLCGPRDQLAQETAAVRVDERALLGGFAAQPLEVACLTGIASIQDYLISSAAHPSLAPDIAQGPIPPVSSVADLSGRVSAAGVALLLHPWALEALSPERYWLLHLAHLLPFDRYVDAMEVRAFAQGMDRPGSGELARECIFEDIVYFLFCLAHGHRHGLGLGITSAAYDSPPDPLLQSKCALVLACLCAPSPPAMRGLMQSVGAVGGKQQAPLLLSPRDLTAFCRVLSAIRPRILPADGAVQRSFLQLQVQQLLRWLPMVLDASGEMCGGEGRQDDCVADETWNTTTTLDTVTHSLHNLLSAEAVDSAVETALTSDRQAASAFDYPVFARALETCFACSYPLLVHLILTAPARPSEPPRPRLADRLVRLASQYAEVAIMERHSTLFLRCMCLAETLTTLDGTPSARLNQGLTCWLGCVFDRVGHSLAAAAPGARPAEEASLGAASGQRGEGVCKAAMQFLCRALVESVSCHSENSLRAVCKWLRVNRHLNHNAVDEYMLCARYRLKAMENADMVVEGYGGMQDNATTASTMASDVGDKVVAGPELNPDRIAAWAAQISSAGTLPSAVSAWCNFSPQVYNLCAPQ